MVTHIYFFLGCKGQNTHTHTYTRTPCTDSVFIRGNCRLCKLTLTFNRINKVAISMIIAYLKVQYVRLVF